MKERFFETNFRGIHDVNCPFVKAAFKGKDGEVYIGFMLIDTGSVNCILNKSVLLLMDDAVINKGKSKRIYSINPTGAICQEVEFEFKMGKEIFSDKFYVSDNTGFDDMGDGFIGIIGNLFLMENDLTLDYSTETLHSSNEFNGTPLDYEFFFPMEFGFKQYHAPVVGLICKDCDLVMLVDSGANNTIITEHALEKAGISVENTGQKGIISGFGYKESETTIGKVDLSFLSAGGTEEEPKICQYSDNIQVLQKAQYILDNIKTPEGEEQMPVSGLLSSSFMQEHKWILDFKNGIIYSHKTA